MTTQDIQINVDFSKGTHFNTVYKNGKLQLQEIGIDDLDQIVYQDSGHWISHTIENSDKFKEYKPIQFLLEQDNSSTYKISVSSSEDNVFWSEFIEIDSENNILNTPSRFIKFKIELSASKRHSEMIADNFTANHFNNEQIIVADGKLKLKKEYTHIMQTDERPNIYTQSINKLPYKKINKFGIAEESDVNVVDGRWSRASSYYVSNGALNSESTIGERLLGEGIFYFEITTPANSMTNRWVGVTSLTNPPWALNGPNQTYRALTSSNIKSSTVYGFEIDLTSTTIGNAKVFENGQLIIEAEIIDKSGNPLINIKPVIGSSASSNSAVQYFINAGQEPFKYGYTKVGMFSFDGTQKMHSSPSLVYDNGIYKKWIDSYDYNSPLDTTVSANSKLTNFFKFDEASGNITDSKGSAVGIITGASRVAGYKGSAMSFDGVDDYVTFNTTVIPTGRKSVRFKIKTTQMGIGIVMSQTAGSAYNGFQINTDATGKLDFLIGKSVSGTPLLSVKSSKVVADGQWHDVLFTWDGTVNANAVKVYIDDMITTDAVGTSSGLETLTPTYNLRLGASNSATINYFFNGQIDELEIYNDVISIDDLFLKITKWETVSTTFPTITQLLEHGMDNLSSLDRKSKTINNQSILTNTLANGKVYKSSIDLSKIIELKSISVE